ncbi:hypothetical protein BDP55DRAFT_667712, partial [Colletotrichum godetiae]
MIRSFPPSVTPSHARHVIVTLHWYILPNCHLVRLLAIRFCLFLFHLHGLMVRSFSHFSGAFYLKRIFG